MLIAHTARVKTEKRLGNATTSSSTDDDGDMNKKRKVEERKGRIIKRVGT